jgi:hypothetical protein
LWISLDRIRKDRIAYSVSSCNVHAVSLRVDGWLTSPNSTSGPLSNSALHFWNYRDVPIIQELLSGFFEFSGYHITNEKAASVVWN